jgi:hypothetical protein
VLDADSVVLGVGAGVLLPLPVPDPVGVCEGVGTAVVLALKEVLAVAEALAPVLREAVGDAEEVELALSVVEGVGCGVLAGGGFKTGQVIGATDRLGGEPTERPVHFGEVFATLYHWLGIDTTTLTLPDLSGRPQYLVDGWSPMKELV